ncbi:Enoyl-CoA hydratase AFT3-1 [Psilocybe cubensis]|uniref:Enoyl-CoA hydratase AFT3-1 n=1 Tax=Psilocybe cubensis TaxID=181762 RepID=A0ACB8H0S3_PSICU|nr:Enoyl-CoA hydratase AFT3-1 [Psilocybe cubensis]KAH9481282.1 Enoyl-CoA hydratase AFT3-1 [Psilocybe cubensis]
MSTSLPDYGALGYKEIIATLDGSVVTVVINRAKYRNTFGGVLDKELINVFQLCDRDDRVRVVILTAEHTAPAYCSGADLTNGWNLLWLEESEKEGEHAHRDSGGQVSLAIMNCRKITIAAINGHAAGVGMTALQLPFDFRFVWAGARLTFPFVRRGIAPEGHSKASYLMLSGAVVSPDSKHISDLYHEIIPTREAVYPTAKAFAEELAANTSQVAVAYTKGLLQHPGDSIEENHLLDSRAIKLLGSSADGHEGVQSFKERRLPKFTGTLSKDSSPWFPWWKRVDVSHYKTKL